MPRGPGLRRFLRFVMPVGLLEAVQAKRTFQKMQSGVSPWRAALSPSLRQMLDSSRLGSFPSEVLYRPKCLVDVGAHVGLWSEAALILLAPEELIAIEPAPDAFQQLSKRIGKRPGVTTIPSAVGASSGKATFRVMNHSQWNSLLDVRSEIQSYYSSVTEVATIDVSVITLDELLHEKPEITLLKIDVQGSEDAVLDGARETLRKTRAVMLEANFVSHYVGDSLFIDIHRRMSDEFGFALQCYAAPYYRKGRIMCADAIYARAL